MLSSELYRVAHVPFGPAVRDQTGPTVDHGISEGSGVVVLRRFRREQVAYKRIAKSRDRIFAD